jgi:hypothetical protein
VARDGAGNKSPESFTVTIHDTTAPVLTEVTLSPASLEAASHEMVRLTPKVSATDAVTANPSLIVVSVTSSQADAGLDAEDVANDIDLRPNGEIYVRAEGTGRAYTLTFKVADAAGNLSAPRTATVTVR